MEIPWGIALFVPLALCVLLCMDRWRAWPIAALALWLPTALPLLNSFLPIRVPFWCYLPICAALIIALRRGGGLGFLRAPVAALRAAPLLALVIAVPALLAFLAALAPEVRGDSIIYHISAAMLFSVNDRMIEMPSSVLTYIPQAWQLFYGVCLDAHSEVLARLCHWFCGILLVAGTAVTARRALRLSLAQSLGTASLVMLFPIWTYLATSTYVDLATALWTLAAMYILLTRSAATPVSADTRAVILAGILAGAAISTKYTAILTGLLPLGSVILLQELDRLRVRSQRASRALGNILLFGCAAFIVFLPWLVRNAVWTGNPVCPSFMEWFGPADVPPSTLTWGDIQPGPHDVTAGKSILYLYATMWFSVSSFGNYLPALAAIMLLLCVTFKVRGVMPAPVRLILVFLLVSYILGIPTGALRLDCRYVMAHVCLLSILILFWYSLIVDAYPTRVKSFRAIAVMTLVLFVLAYARGTWNLFRDLNEAVLPPCTAQARAAYRAARLENYDANMALAASDWARRVYKGEKILGPYYPARLNYVLLGRPLRDTAALPVPENLTAVDMARLDANDIRFVFGNVPDTVKPFMTELGAYGGKTLYAISSERR